jgi:hypothetical protein
MQTVIAVLYAAGLLCTGMAKLIEAMINWPN